MSSNISQSKSLPTYPGVIGLGMTFFRIVIALFCIPLVLLAEMDETVALSIAMIVLLDYYDGKFFRKSSLNHSEKWRRIRRVIDSCGDRLCIQAVCIPLLVVQPLFLYPYIVICTKEILTSTVCLRSFFQGLIIYPSTVSRISTALVGVTVISQLLCNVQITFLCSTILLLSGILSLYQYIRKINQYNNGMLMEGRDYERV